MPEGHTIHRLAGAFNSLFAGRAVETVSPQGRFTAGAELLSGRTIVRAQAWGKHLFVHFDDEFSHTLHVHLGLYGSWTFAGDGTIEVTEVIGAPRRRVGEGEVELAVVDESFPPPPRGQVRLRILEKHAVADLTGPTTCAVRTVDEVQRVIARLGPDPLHPDADAECFIVALQRRRIPIAAALMDQSVIAGVGNIYRAEALFRAGVDPMKPSNVVSIEDAMAIWHDLVELMTDGVKVGRIITTKTSPHHSRFTAYLSQSLAPTGPFYVYQRTGLGCEVCATPIAMTELAGRKLYWCPTCQSSS
ncbi:endonuclease-8 [Micrococcales bacterium KH10]|nr:endonuclease-8 [Micrococcales bacterium KH10]